MSDDTNPLWDDLDPTSTADILAIAETTANSLHPVSREDARQVAELLRHEINERLPGFDFEANRDVMVQTFDAFNGLCISVVEVVLAPHSFFLPCFAEHMEDVLKYVTSVFLYTLEPDTPDPTL